MARLTLLACLALKELSLAGGTNARGARSSSKVVSTIFIGKWEVEILSCLHKRPYHHAELPRQLESVSQRILTRTLRNLESGGRVARRVTKSKSIAVEYFLDADWQDDYGATDQHLSLGRSPQGTAAAVRLHKIDKKRSHGEPVRS